MLIAIITVSIINMFLVLLACGFCKLWKESEALLNKTKNYYAKVLEEQNDAVSENLPEDGKCPLGSGSCWKAMQQANYEPHPIIGQNQLKMHTKDCNCGTCVVNRKQNET